jgi:hypothetical protein
MNKSEVRYRGFVLTPSTEFVEGMYSARLTVRAPDATLRSENALGRFYTEVEARRFAILYGMAEIDGRELPDAKRAEDDPKSATTRALRKTPLRLAPHNPPTSNDHSRAPLAVSKSIDQRDLPAQREPAEQLAASGQAKAVREAAVAPAPYCPPLSVDDSQTALAFSKWFEQGLRIQIRRYGPDTANAGAPQSLSRHPEASHPDLNQAIVKGHGELVGQPSTTQRRWRGRATPR